jgi:hypothetical protein
VKLDPRAETNIGAPRKILDGRPQDRVMTRGGGKEEADR